MFHKAFAPYHNRHIEVQMKSGEVLTGIAVDTLMYAEKYTNTEYCFVKTEDMEAWEKAKKEENLTAKKEVETKIDIMYVEDVRHL